MESNDAWRRLERNQVLVVHHQRHSRFSTWVAMRRMRDGRNYKWIDKKALILFHGMRYKESGYYYDVEKGKWAYWDGTRVKRVKKKDVPNLPPDTYFLFVHYEDFSLYDDDPV